MSSFKKKIAMYTTMLAFLSLSSASVVQAIDASDVMGRTSNMDVHNSAATISGTTKRVDVNNIGGAGAVGQVDWSKFSVGSNEHVNFGFSNVSQTIINRVLGGQASQILGKMTNSCTDGICTNNVASGKVILINPAGVMFGAGSQIDINSLTTSTFDFRGAQNLKGMSETALRNYQADTLNKFDARSNNSTITFDRSYTAAFDKAGISKDRGDIELNGSTFDHFYNPSGINTENVNKNKSLNFISDNVKYKDSVLKTGGNLNYGDYRSDSNVKIITSDGVTFGYYNNGSTKAFGNENSDSKIIDNGSNISRSIDINNSGLGDKTAIQSGDVQIHNKSGNVKLSNSVIKADKLVNAENGDIKITSSKDVNINNVRLETSNTGVTLDGKTYTTNDKVGGVISVNAGGDTSIKDSLLLSAGQDSSNAHRDSGAIAIQSGNSTTLDNTDVVARGDAYVISQNNTTLKNNSIVYAANENNTAQKHNVDIEAGNNVTMQNSSLGSNGETLVFGKDINVSSDVKNGKNNSVIYGADKVTFEAQNTKLDNTSLMYKNLEFKDNGKANNVTIANNTTFGPLNNNGEVQSDVNIQTNGNLTFDGAKVQTADYKIGVDTKDTKGHFAIKGGTHNTANNITATSNNGDITVKNSSYIHAKNNINMNSKTGNYTQDKSQLYAGKDVKISAKNVSITNQVPSVGGLNEVHAENDVVINASGSYTQNNAELYAKNNASINAKGKANIANKSFVTAENDTTITAESITISDSTVNAVRNNATLTATGSGDNGNITLSNSTVEAANHATVKSTKGKQKVIKLPLKNQMLSQVLIKQTGIKQKMQAII